MSRPPKPGTVHVWRFNLDAEQALPGVLSAEENARAARFCFERDVRRWQAGRSLLRQTLGAYLQADPGAIEFKTGPHGKPFLPGSRLRFNLSHSEALLLLAVTSDREVGIDAERLRDDFVPEELAAQVCSPREQDALCFLPPPERCAAFLALWTAKEASAKALGLGLSFPLPQLMLSPQPGSDFYAAENASSVAALDALSVCRLPPLPGYAASLAVLGPLTVIEHFSHDHAPHQHSSNQHCCSGV